MEGEFISEGETASTGTPSAIGSPLHHHHHHNNNSVFTVEYNEDVLPIPYCGCEPLKCHLMKTARTFEDIIIDRVRGVASVCQLQFVLMFELTPTQYIQLLLIITNDISVSPVVRR